MRSANPHVRASLSHATPTWVFNRSRKIKAEMHQILQVARSGRHLPRSAASGAHRLGCRCKCSSPPLLLLLLSSLPVRFTSCGSFRGFCEFTFVDKKLGRYFPAVEELPSCSRVLCKRWPRLSWVSAWVGTVWARAQVELDWRLPDSPDSFVVPVRVGQLTALTPLLSPFVLTKPLPSLHGNIESDSLRSKV